MSKLPNDTGSSVSVSTPVRSTTVSKICVILPVMLALMAIFSTTLPAETQSQMMMGLPVILWFWFAIALLICAITFVFAFKVMNAQEDTQVNNQANNNGGNEDE